MASNAVTRTEQVFTALRSDILGGYFAPGQRLPFAELRERYNASVGVVREALLRLSEQSLAIAEPQLGFRVITISAPDLRDLTEARVEIEGLVLRQALDTGDIAWESQVLAAHHSLERTPQRDPRDPKRFSEEWAVVHGIFHNTLLKGCRNARLLAIALSLRDAAELYRRWSLPLGGDDQRDVAGEHKALLDAVLAHDVNLAISLQTMHIKRTTQVLLNVFDSEAERAGK
jgi:DNA-binding GntR family transcriptional regulator